MGCLEKAQGLIASMLSLPYTKSSIARIGASRSWIPMAFPPFRRCGCLKANCFWHVAGGLIQQRAQGGFVKRPRRLVASSPHGRPTQQHKCRRSPPRRFSPGPPSTLSFLHLDVRAATRVRLRRFGSGAVATGGALAAEAVVVAARSVRADGGAVPAANTPCAAVAEVLRYVCAGRAC